MCLINVKDEEERAEAVRVKVQRVRRSPSPRTARISRRSIIEERRPASSLPSIRPSTVNESTTIIRSEREVSRERSRPPSIAPSRAPSARSRVRSAYVEVDHESSSSEGESDVLSKTTSRTRKSSRSRTTAPASEYSVHEREVRRERGYSRPQEEYETYRYVEPPRSVSRASAPRSSYYDPPRASRDSFGKRVVIEDDFRRRTREYR